MAPVSPFYRFERLQESLGVPLPASVQWEQAERVAVLLEPLFDHLLYLGVQAAVVHNDDTTMRVSNLRLEIKAEVKPERTGIFTTGIVGKADQHPVRLFFTGRAHAGENLARVLAEREPGLDPPLNMCDGLSRNTPKGHAVVVCNCNVHARRNFVDIRAAFPEESRRVVECYSEIYRMEAKAKKEKLSPEGRLKLHQELSQPVMDRLKSDFTKSLETRQVEPNSGLGQSMTYMIERWDALTQFLRIPGAPFDNKCRRTTAQNRDPAPQEQPALQNGAGSGGGRLLHELDPDLRGQRGQSVRLPSERRPECRSGQNGSGPVDALELQRGPGRRSACAPPPKP